MKTLCSKNTRPESGPTDFVLLPIRFPWHIPERINIRNTTYINYKYKNNLE
jgi:hypothetical protein